MDAGTLRIILLVIGIAGLGALFLWERRRAERSDADRRSHLGQWNRSKREPNLGLNDTDDDERASSLPIASQGGDLGVRVEGLEKPQLEGIIIGTEEGPIAQVFLVAQEGLLSGGDILSAAQRHLLDPGPKNIFHRFAAGAEESPALFSMANLVQPGAFPLQPTPAEGMATFTTHGLALFTLVRGIPQDIEAVDGMLATAELLAEELSAKVEDAKHQPITIERVDVLRACVLNYDPAATVDAD